MPCIQKNDCDAQKCKHRCSRRCKLKLSCLATVVFTIAAIAGALHGQFPQPCVDESVPTCPNGVVLCSDGSVYDGPTPEHPYHHHHHHGHGCGRGEARPICSVDTEKPPAGADVFQTAVSNCTDARSTEAPAMVAACVTEMGDSHADWCASRTQKVFTELCEDMAKERLSPRCADSSLPRSLSERVQIFVNHWHHKHSEHGDDESERLEHDAQSEDAHEHGEHGNHGAGRKHHHCHGFGAAVLAALSGLCFLWQVRMYRRECDERQDEECKDGYTNPLRERLCCGRYKPPTSSGGAVTFVSGPELVAKVDAVAVSVPDETA